MWPASPKNPTLAFHQDLLLWLESLVLEGCMGVDAFCRALECKRGVAKHAGHSHQYIVST